MDKFSELKRLAEKCPVPRFEPFIGRAGGRGTQAIFNADTKGEVITWSGFDSSDVTSRTGREAIARFVAAVDPETVLALLAELEATRKQSQELAKQCGRLGARAAIAERKLAKPIQIVNYDEFFICHVSGASDDYCKGWVDGRNAAARDVVKAGFTVEGDE